MKRLLLLLLLNAPIYAMNQVVPTDTQSKQSDEDIVAAALPSDTPPLHAKLIPLVAANIRANSNPEAAMVTKSIVLAANDILGNSINKTTSGYITGGCTLVGALITAIATAYATSKKC